MFRTIYVRQGQRMVEDNFVVRYSEEFAEVGGANLEIVMSREIQPEEGLDVSSGFCHYSQERTSNLSRYLDQYFEVIFVHAFFTAQQRNTNTRLALSDTVLAYYYPTHRATQNVGSRVLTSLKYKVICQLVEAYVSDNTTLRQFNEFFRRETPRLRERYEQMSTNEHSLVASSRSIGYHTTTIQRMRERVGAGDDL
jgi:hypothetical protein